VISTEMANQATPEDVSKFYQKIAADQKIDLSKPANVVVARDTRASGSRLLGCLIDGLKSAGAEYKDYGFLTTPQLHYMVRCLNTEGTSEAYGDPTEVGYYEKFSSAFKKAMGSKKINVLVDRSSTSSSSIFLQVRLVSRLLLSTITLSSRRL
jgi:phosphoacetylglucosamine mutase